ncbi:acyltransferase [Geomonas nitrogeniifigens]|uniref:Acyltransferase n=1 Tax=Geomonas diazotrophica TaxID=2843197 RepID=A0ABX8JH38_9BACT|nr:acyltransferase [Geomonas nitrogeniifigens]QWV95964.1 acyltransferase [Geomonas nitrogeniifigens]
MNQFRDVANFVMFFLPVSRFFGLKRFLLSMAGVEVGPDVKVNGRTWFYGNGKVRIGARTWIGPGCQFHSTSGTTINIGDDCDVAPMVMFVTGTHKFGTSSRRAGEGFGLDVNVENGCWLGARVTVLGNARVGSGSFIAAGAVVSSDIPPNTLAAGVPARPKRSFDGV